MTSSYAKLIIPKTSMLSMVSAMTEVIHEKEQLLRLVSSLSIEERKELYRILQTMDDHHRKTGSRASISDLKGLGKEIWRSIDIEEHVNRERDSWD